MRTELTDAMRKRVENGANEGEVLDEMEDLEIRYEKVNNALFKILETWDKYAKQFNLPVEIRTRIFLTAISAFDREEDENDDED